MSFDTALPRVSVALCAYNGGTYIAEQLESILAQTHRPFEVVIADDGSTDDTLAIARRVANDFNDRLGETISKVDVRFVENSSRLGITKNFELAISQTGGDLVALSDQDDIWHAQRLETLTKKFQVNSKLQLVGSNAAAIDGLGRDLGFDLFSAISVTEDEWTQLSNGGAFEALLRRNLFTGATMMFRRELFSAAAPFASSWLHDEWLAVIAASQGEVLLSKEVLTDYRQHGANQAGISQQTLSNRIRKVRKLFSPRTASNRSQLARATDLLSHLESSDSAEVVKIQLAREKVLHEEARSALPTARIRRVAPVLREIGTTRYGRFDYGARDVMRDLLRPE